MLFILKAPITLTKKALFEWDKVFENKKDIFYLSKLPWLIKICK